MGVVDAAWQPRGSHADNQGKENLHPNLPPRVVLQQLAAVLRRSLLESTCLSLCCVALPPDPIHSPPHLPPGELAGSLAETSEVARLSKANARLKDEVRIYAFRPLSLPARSLLLLVCLVVTGGGGGTGDATAAQYGQYACHAQTTRDAAGSRRAGQRCGLLPTSTRYPPHTGAVIPWAPALYHRTHRAARA